RHLDRLAPVSRISAPRVTRSRTILLRWSGHDPRAAGLIASGISYYLVYVRVDGGRTRRVARSSRHTLKFATRPGNRYQFYTVAVPGDGQQLLQRGVDPVRDHLDIGQRVVVAQQAVVDSAVVGHDRDRQPVVLGQERDREQVLELSPEHVQRYLRSRDVGDDQV